MTILFSLERHFSNVFLQVITSCNSTKDELVLEVDNFNVKTLSPESETMDQESIEPSPFRYLNHVQTYPTFMFAGLEGSRVATVAFQRRS